MRWDREDAASQYRSKRALLFANPTIRPEFELDTLAAVQPIASNEWGLATSFDALEHMEGRVRGIESDVAIVGAGAYGMQLAAAVKSMGMRAIRLVCATRLRFGTRGRWWQVESGDDIASLFNEHWVPPSAEGRSQGATLVEGGCYWEAQ